MLAPGGVRCAARRLLRAPEPRASPPCARSVSSASASASPSLPAALLFDCDGVLCDTERDGHRPTFNAAFAAAGLSCAWDEDEYGELLKTGGGKASACGCVAARRRGSATA